MEAHATVAGAASYAATVEDAGANRRTAQQMAAIDELKDALIETVAHELRSPLAAVMGFAELLRRDPPQLSGAERQEVLDRLYETATQMDLRLRNLLDLERVTHGALRPQPTQVPLRTAVQLAVEGCTPLASRPVDVDVPDLHVIVDPGQLASLLDALLRNAARHTPPGTPVWIRAWHEHDERVVLSVEDAGPGVPDRDKDRLFEPYRVGETTTLRVTGLSLVARLAALNGGAAWVDDREGGGAAFRLRLPAG